MASHPQRVWSRNGLLDAVKGFDYVGDDRAVDSYVRRLRIKITSKEGDRRQYIKTHFGSGYSFEDN